MMNAVRLFDPQLDAETVLSWARDHRFPYDVSMLPPTTWIVPGYIVGAVFTTNQPAVAFLDYVVGNPQSDKNERDMAFEALLRHIETTTYAAGIRRLIMISNNPAVIARCKKWGCIVTEPRQLAVYEFSLFDTDRNQ